MSLAFGNQNAFHALDLRGAGVRSDLDAGIRDARSDVLLPGHDQSDHLGAARGGDEAAVHRGQAEAGQREVDE